MNSMSEVKFPPSTMLGVRFDALVIAVKEHLANGITVKAVVMFRSSTTFDLRLGSTIIGSALGRVLADQLGHCPDGVQHDRTDVWAVIHPIGRGGEGGVREPRRPSPDPLVDHEPVPIG